MPCQVTRQTQQSDAPRVGVERARLTARLGDPQKFLNQSQVVGQNRSELGQPLGNPVPGSSRIVGSGYPEKPVAQQHEYWLQGSSMSVQLCTHLRDRHKPGLAPPGKFEAESALADTGRTR